MTDAFAQWGNFYSESDLNLQHPSESLVRMMKGNYVPGLDKDYSGKK